MKTTLLASSIILSLLSFASCASHLEVVPEVDRSQIPPLELSQVKPRQIDISVTVDRKINKITGNTAQVEAAVREVLTDSLIRGGFSVAPSLDHSKNSLQVDLTDCLDGVEGGECLKYEARLKTSKWTVTGSGTVSNGYERENHSGGEARRSFGNVSKAYQDALRLMIQGLEKEAQKLKGEGL